MIFLILFSPPNRERERKKKEPHEERSVPPLSAIQNAHIPCVRCVPGSGVMTITSAEIRTVVQISL